MDETSALPAIAPLSLPFCVTAALPTAGSVLSSSAITDNATITFFPRRYSQKLLQHNSRPCIASLKLTDGTLGGRRCPASQSGTTLPYSSQSCIILTDAMLVPPPIPCIPCSPLAPLFACFNILSHSIPHIIFCGLGVHAEV